MVHLSCPICPHGFLADVRELQLSISSVLTRSLYCPICSETLIGLPALDAHLAQHLPYRQGFTSNSVQSSNLIENLSTSNLIQDSFLTKERDPFNSSPDGRPHGTSSRMRISGVEAIPSLEKLEITDDKLSAEFARSLSTIDGSSNSPASPKLVYMQNLSRTSSRCSVPGDEVRSCREWSAPPSVEQHSCETCGLVFSSEHFLQLHMDVIHKHSDCFEVSCKICIAKFGDLESYRNHVRESHRERRYLCEECPKTFKLRGSLVVHKRMYHDGSPSACQICNKKFPSNTRKEFHERRYHATGSKSIFRGKSFLHGPSSSIHDLTRHDTETQSCSRSIQDAKHSLENLMEQTKLGKEATKPDMHSNIIQTINPPCPSTSAIEKCDVQTMSQAVPLQSEKISNTSDSFVSNLGPSSRQSQLRDSSQAVTALGDPTIVVRLEPELLIKAACIPSTNVSHGSGNHGTNIMYPVNNNYQINNGLGETQQVNGKQKVNKLEQLTQSPLQSFAPQFSISVPSNIGGIENEEGSLSNFLLARQMSCANNSKYFDILQQLSRNSPNTCLSILTSSTNSIEGSERQNFPFPQALIRNKTSGSVITSVSSEIDARLDISKEDIFVGNGAGQHTNNAHGHPQQESQQVGGDKEGGMCEGGAPVEDITASFAKPVTPEENVSRGCKENKGETSPAGAGDSKQWQCDVCKKNFTTKYFLKKHKRLHTGETPYCCGECGKTFTFQQSYHKHVLYHSDEKPHSCSYCGRSFKEMSTLHNHVRIHTGEKPFVCETCGKAFRQRVSYLVHLRIHTGALPYTCTECGKSFRYKVSLRSHKCEIAPKNSNGGTPEQVPSPGNNSSSTTTAEPGAGNAVTENLPSQHGASCINILAKENTKLSISDSFRVASQDAVGHLSTSDNLAGDIQDMDIDTETEMSHAKKCSESSDPPTQTEQGVTSTDSIKPTFIPTRLLTAARDTGTSYAPSSSSDLLTPPLTDATTNHHIPSGWSIPLLAGKLNTTVKSPLLIEDSASNFVKQFNTILSGSQILDKSNWAIDLLQGTEPESRTAILDNIQRNVSDSKDIMRQEAPQVMEAVYPSQMETCAGVSTSFQAFSHVLNSKPHNMQVQQQQQQHPSPFVYLQQPQQLQEHQSSELRSHYQSKDSHLHQNDHQQSQQRPPTSSGSTILTLSPHDSDEETDLDPESFFRRLFT